MKSNQELVLTAFVGECLALSLLVWLGVTTNWRAAGAIFGGWLLVKVAIGVFAGRARR